MATQEEFTQAAEQVKTLSTRPNNDQLLDLYALYKQGTEGDVQGKRPGLLDVKGRAKYDAWAKQHGKPREAAQQAYIALVQKLMRG